eukprot:jgi/Mesvir1/66/Mv13670-RA.1
MKLKSFFLKRGQSPSSSPRVEENPSAISYGQAVADGYADDDGMPISESHKSPRRGQASPKVRGHFATSGGVEPDWPPAGMPELDPVVAYDGPKSPLKEKSRMADGARQRQPAHAQAVHSLTEGWFAGGGPVEPAAPPPPPPPTHHDDVINFALDQGDVTPRSCLHNGSQSEAASFAVAAAGAQDGSDGSSRGRGSDGAVLAANAASAKEVEEGRSEAIVEGGMEVADVEEEEAGAADVVHRNKAGGRRKKLVGLQRRLTDLGAHDDDVVLNDVD